MELYIQKSVRAVYEDSQLLFPGGLHHDGKENFFNWIMSHWTVFLLFLKRFVKRNLSYFLISFGTLKTCATYPWIPLDSGVSVINKKRMFSVLCIVIELTKTML